ncbi:MAG TPA: PIG-L family deacetylase [Gaiellaceae bacterium]|nr:PIG-L family deacetylase [Gaiellaceae bacterium]
MSAHPANPHAVPVPQAPSSWKARVANVGRRSLIGLLGLMALVAACALAAAPARAASSGPVLVVVAHPDDEALGFAGVIERAITDGRPVDVAIVTNGAAVSNPNSASVCGAADGVAAGFAAKALERDRETEAAMAVLGGTSLLWTQSLATSHVFFLGYPDGGLPTIVAGQTFVDPSGLNRTFADSGGDTTCNGDYHFLRTLGAAHATLTAASLAGDLDALLAQVQPTDVYTHGVFDGHPDHAAVARQVIAALERSTLSVDLHSTLIHETGDAACQAASASWWPNPDSTSDPVQRSTPALPFAAPPVFATNDPALNDTGFASCPDGNPPVGHDWGPLGRPTDELTVPADMQTADLSANKKWLSLAQYTTQLGCPSDASCGYMHGFIKSDEILWTQPVSAAGAPVPLDWPRLSGSTIGSELTLTVRWPTTAAAAFAGTTTGFTYQWLRCAADNRFDCTPIGSATNAPTSYTAVAADVGFSLRVQVVARNSAGAAPAVYSGSTDPIHGAPANTVPPSIAGVAVVGQALTASPGTWSGAPAPSFAYQWQRSANNSSGWSSIAGQTAATYTVVTADAGSYLRVQVTATNDGGSDLASSDATVRVATAPAMTAAPTLAGSAVEGQTLTASSGTWAGDPVPSVAYQWQTSATGTSGWAPIAGATGSTYVVRTADVGAFLRVLVTASSSAGTASGGSVPTAQVTAAPSSGGRGGTSSGGGGSSSGGGGGGTGAADLRLDGTAEPLQAAVGDTIVYRVNVNDYNTGPATGVWVDIQLPAGVSLVSTYADRGKGCTLVEPGRLHCDLDWLADTAQFGHVIVTVTVTATGDHVLIATTGYSHADPVPTDNSVTLTVSTPSVTPPPVTPVVPAAPKPAIGILTARAAANGKVTVRVKIAGWTVNTKQVKNARATSGYWVIYVDGKRNAVSRRPGSGVTGKLAPGRHTLRVELVRENGRLVSPRVLSRPVVVRVPARKPSRHVNGA